MKGLNGIWLETSQQVGDDDDIGLSVYSDIEFDKNEKQLVNLFTGAILKKHTDGSESEQDITVLKVAGQETYIDQPYNEVKTKLKENGLLL